MIDGGFGDRVWSCYLRRDAECASLGVSKGQARVCRETGGWAPHFQPTKPDPTNGISPSARTGVRITECAE